MKFATGPYAMNAPNGWINMLTIGKFGTDYQTRAYNSDGSLDVFLQRKSPGAEKESNWLPIPLSDMFNVTLRIYNPKKESLDPSYKFPPIRKVASS